MKKNSISSKKLNVGIIHRDEIPALNEIKIGDNLHNLGILKDFRKHPYLEAFMPEQARVSMSWVSLKPNEILATHVHPTSSMIIVCEGDGEVMGNRQQSIRTGDIVAVPPHHKHGFIGRGKKGFWGLSIQFEGLGLYEDPEAARVQFLEGKESKQIDLFDALLRSQKHFQNAYKRSSLMKLLKSPTIQDPQVQERLLEVLNRWGNWFQRIIFARAAIGGRPKYQEVAEDHIREEAGHNKNLFEARNSKPLQIWDSILEAAASWFHEKMLSGTDPERTILVHFVLEASGEIFHHEAAKIFPTIRHFRIHSAVDEEHFEMGCRLLRETTNLDFDNLKEILAHGWAMMEMLCHRMAHIAKYGAKAKGRKT